MADSRYPTRNLRLALQSVFGEGRSIIDCSKATEMGAMVGVPVTTINDVSTCVFSNYNGVGKRDDSTGKSTSGGPTGRYGKGGQRGRRVLLTCVACTDYHVLQPEMGMSQIPLWKM